MTKVKKKYINWKYKNVNPLLFMFEICNEKSFSKVFFRENPNITMEFVLKHPHIKWDWDYLSVNLDITLTDILAHPKLPWNWYGVSQNCNTTLIDILKHPELPWRWNCISSNASITLNDILKHPDLPWDWEGVSNNPNIRLTDILTYPELPWNWRCFLENPHIAKSPKFLEIYLTKSQKPPPYMSPYASLKIILQYPEIRREWSYFSVYMNRKDIFENLDLPWVWDYVSWNTNITLSDVLKNRNLPWNWRRLSSNSAITFQEILAHPELPWDWDHVSMNANLTLSDVLKQNPEKNWTLWNGVFSNKFLYDNKVYEKNIKRDIKGRREKIDFLALFGSLETLVNKYVGYV